MEITKTNFMENLPKIKQSIRNADFIAIDCEMTGLNDGVKINQYDTPKQYYEKLRSSSMNFTVIQYGLCMFRYDDTLKGFKQQGYNFYIFPTVSNKYTSDHRFLCQTSSINFLISHGFDFNKMFKEGISYLSRAEETRYKDLLEETQKTRINPKESCSPKPVSAADKEIVDDIFKRIEQFIISNDEKLQLPQCNSYIRRIVYNEAISKLKNRATLGTKKVDDNVVFFVTRWKNKEADERKKIQAEMEEFEKCKGFSEVIKCIVESEKLIVGHNMVLDVLHTIDKFLQILPTDYEEFKGMANCLFANLLDTKYMSSLPPINNFVLSTALPNLLQTVKSDPFKIPVIEIEENGAGYDLNCAREHEAGYDAYITGLCFLAMWNYLGSSTSTDHFKDFSLLAPYKNRLYLMRLVDNPCIHLGGVDPSPSRDHILHLTFPKEWTTINIYQLFTSFGGLDNIDWLDENSAYVSLQKRDQVGAVLRNLKSNECQITTFANRQAQFNSKTQLQLKRKITVNEPNVKKRKTDTIVEKIDVTSKNTYASTTVKLKSPSMSPPSPKPQNKTSKKNPSVTKTKKAKSKLFQEESSWD